MSEINNEENKTVEETAANETPENPEVIDELKEEASDGAKAEETIEALDEKEEVAPEEKTQGNSVEDAEEAADKLEEESLYELQVLREANNEYNEELVDDAEKKIKDIFNEFRDWIRHNSEPEQVKKNLEDARNQAINVMNQTKDKVLEISNSEDFKKAVSGIKQFLDGTGGLIGEGFRYGKEQLCKNPYIKDAFDNFDNGVERLKENPNLAAAVNKAEEVTQDLSSKFFGGLKNFFTGTPKEAPKPEETETPAEEPAENTSSSEESKGE